MSEIQTIQYSVKWQDAVTKRQIGKKCRSGDGLIWSMLSLKGFYGTIKSLVKIASLWAEIWNQDLWHMQQNW
jgi:hypothetical protein